MSVSEPSVADLKAQIVKLTVQHAGMDPSTTSSVSVADLKARVVELTVRRLGLDRQIEEVRTQWQALCLHQWRRYRDTREGRYCVLCERHDDTNS